MTTAERLDRIESDYLCGKIDHQQMLDAVAVVRDEIKRLCPAVPPKRKRQPRVPADTVAEMVTRHEAGETLAAIGRDFGITRERVRQLIARAKGQPVKRSTSRRGAA